MNRLYSFLSLTILASTMACGPSGIENSDSQLNSSSQSLNPPGLSVQMFRWRWKDIARECTQWLGPKGFGGVQVSPPMAAANLEAWWGVYQPVNFNSLQSQMGSEAEFKAMINTCHAAKVRVYVDVVVNHMSAVSGKATDGSTFDSASMSFPNFSSADFHSTCHIQGGDYGTPGNRSSVVNCRLANLPDLKTESGYAQGQIRAYFNKLVGLGVDGIRIDAAKHINPTHISAILATANRTTTSGEALWVTQEVIPDGNANRDEYLANGTLNEFHYTTAMKEAFRKQGTSISKIPTMMGMPGAWGGTWKFLPSHKATVFINNWDSERYGTSLVASNNVSGQINDTVGTRRYNMANMFMLAWPYGDVQLHSGYRFTNKDQGPPAASPYNAAGEPLINQAWDFTSLAGPG